MISRSQLVFKIMSYPCLCDKVINLISLSYISSEKPPQIISQKASQSCVRVTAHRTRENKNQFQSHQFSGLQNSQASDKKDTCQINKLFASALPAWATSSGFVGWCTISHQNKLRWNIFFKYTCLKKYGFKINK